MQKVTRATQYLSEALGIGVTGLFDGMEVPSLSVKGYEKKGQTKYERDPLDSPSSLIVGMDLPLMYDPDFPPLEFVDEMAEIIENMKREDSEIKGVALVLMGDNSIDIYTTDKEYTALKEIHGVDITPEIHYNSEGIAVQFVSYCLHNLVHLARSVYGFTSKREYTEWHEDPEHGGWFQAQVVPKSRLERLDEHNPHTIPLAKVLGSDERTVREILAQKGHEAKHIAHPESLNE
jgi:hypothetical protein